jgi:hypothetical protein
MALDGLKKTDKRKDADLDALKALEKGASLTINTPKESSAAFKRCNFSLTEAISSDIDKLSLLPRTFKFSRSEVVRAGIEALNQMKESDLIAFFEKLKNE